MFTDVSFVISEPLLRVYRLEFYGEEPETEVTAVLSDGHNDTGITVAPPSEIGEKVGDGIMWLRLVPLLEKANSSLQFTIIGKKFDY